MNMMNMIQVVKMTTVCDVRTNLLVLDGCVLGGGSDSAVAVFDYCHQTHPSIKCKTHN